MFSFLKSTKSKMTIPPSLKIDVERMPFVDWIKDSKIKEICYHGTDQVITGGFHPLSHFGTEKASQYIIEKKRYKGARKGDCLIIPVYLRLLSVLELHDMNDNHTTEHFIDMFNTATRRSMFNRLSRNISCDEFISAVSLAGYDGFTYILEREDRDSRAYVNLYPWQVRSEKNPEETFSQ